MRHLLLNPHAWVHKWSKCAPLCFRFLASELSILFSCKVLTNPDTVCVVSMQQILDLAVEEPVLSCDEVRHQVFEIAEVLASVSQISEEEVSALVRSLVESRADSGLV